MTMTAFAASEAGRIKLAIGGWAAGWTLAVPLTMAAFAYATRPEDAAPLTVIGLLLATSILAFGLPAFWSARLGGSERPVLEGAAWGIAFFLAMLFVLGDSIFPTAIPEFNIVTTADIMRRRESAQTFHYPPLAVRFVQALALFGGAVGLVSGFLSTRPRSTAAWQMVASVAFGVSVAVALPIAAIASIIVVPIVAHLASIGQSGGMEMAGVVGGFVASAALVGASVGSVVEIARRVLIAPSAVL